MSLPVRYTILFSIDSYADPDPEHASLNLTAMFFGHTHEDQFMIYYANNATNINEQTAQTVGWIGPSITPLNYLNSGFRMYEIDAEVSKQ